MNQNGKTLWIVLGIIAGFLFFFVLMPGCMVISKYNQIVTMDNQIQISWAQVENVLQRRYDLIPNLVNTVKGYAKHERTIFDEFAQARKMMAGARSVGEKLRANDMLSGVLGRLMVVVERYPDLKANQSFQKLMDELAGTENRIAVERKRYNESVGIYNILVSRFPGNIVAGIFSFEKKSEAYFKAKEEAQEVPKVKFE